MANARADVASSGEYNPRRLVPVPAYVSSSEDDWWAANQHVSYLGRLEQRAVKPSATSKHRRCV